ncbi:MULTISPECIES: helix-turn-helix transcriptional regulator [Paraburkholderia]|uniref:DNA-binding CsgD family transcriptional regulator n=1 Tax=Paraburkholderia youngii TaxID=2782701 RepID=A0A7W8L953_9BURK|nr:helix-turn-helix transcriptional regulator [Paraburkholderia youngii]MBB5402288.1 DNA-binding CsgD family transcriptional regulator [Paraburkholderia youngii]
MGRVDDIHAAVRLVYQAALHPGEWHAALDSVVNAIGAHKAVLNGVTGDAVGVVASTGIEPSSALRLHHEFASRMPDWISAIPAGTSLRQSSAISDADFRRSDLYNEVVRPAGGFYGIVTPLVRTPVRQVYLSCGRELGAADFDNEDVDALNLVVPHLINSLEVGKRLVRADANVKSVFDLLDRASVGVILFDAALCPVFVNRRAEALASSGDGLVLSKRTVAATKHAETLLLQKAMAGSVGLHDIKRNGRESAIQQAAPTRCYLSRDPPRLPLVVRIMPFDLHQRSGAYGDAGESNTTRGALFLTEADRAPNVDADVLVETFRLTRREAQLAVLLANGYCLEEAATKLTIGLGTARGYLKQILGKTFTHRQAELVALILRSSLQAFESADGR